MKETFKIISTNRKARFDYEVEQSLEVGIVLQGTEVKSIRAGMVNLKDSFAKFIGDELWLVNTHISEYRFGNIHNHNPSRSRKLLLHKKELAKLAMKVHERGLTLVPLKIYIKNNLIKIELGLCKGKKLYDKRETTKNKEIKREMERVIKNYNR